MNDTAHIYRAEILRAVLGPQATEAKVHDPQRLNQIAERLADCEEAQGILRAKGHGSAGMSLISIARTVPENVRGILGSLFRRPAEASTNRAYPDLGEVHDIWSTR